MNAQNIQIKFLKPTPFLGAIIEQQHRIRRERFPRYHRPTLQCLHPTVAPQPRAIRLVAVLSIAATLLFLAPRASAVDPLAMWTARTSPYGTTNNWRAVAFGNGKFVAVNQSAGLVITSANGTDWSPQSANTNRALYGLAFGNGKFVAAGNSGLIMTSTDGVSWQPRNSGSSAHLYHVNFGNGQFVAVGESGNILSSPDGVTWTSRSTASTNKWNASAFGNGTNVVVGYRTQSPTSYTRSAAAPNFNNWDVRDTGSTMYLSGVTFGQGKFVAVGYAGQTQLSTDGVNWSAPTYPAVAWFYKVVFDNNTFVAAGETAIVTSTNGTTWDVRYSQLGKTMQGIAFGNNTWAIVGNNGLILQSDPVTTAATGAVLLTDAARTGSTFSFKFNGTDGGNYQVQASTNLINWITLTNILCTNSPTSCALTGQTMPKRFYRVVKP
jgi:hypothetical protein